MIIPFCLFLPGKCHYVLWALPLRHAFQDHTLSFWAENSLLYKKNIKFKPLQNLCLN